MNKSKSPDADARMEAHQLGIEVGMLVAGAIVHLDILNHLGPVLQAMQSSPVFEDFSKSLLGTITKAATPGPQGVKVRSEMAYQLNLVHGEMKKRATEFAVDSRGHGGEKVLMKLHHMMETSRACGAAADALFEPIEQNLHNLIESGQRLAAMQQMQKQHEALQQAEAIAAHDCGNPDCPVHTKN